MVHRHIEKALNLGGMQIHGHHPIRAGTGDQIGHQFSGDRDSALVLTILSGISVVRNHGRNARGTRPHTGIDHDQQFHQAVIHGRAGGLDQIDVSASHIINFAMEFTVRKGLETAIPKVKVQKLTDGLCQRQIGSATEDFQFVHTGLLCVWREIVVEKDALFPNHCPNETGNLKNAAKAPTDAQPSPGRRRPTPNQQTIRYD